MIRHYRAIGLLKKEEEKINAKSQLFSLHGAYNSYLANCAITAILYTQSIGN